MRLRRRGRCCIRWGHPPFFGATRHNSGGGAAIQDSVSNGEDKPLPVSSSTPPEFPAEQEYLFSQVLKLLREQGVPFVVAGAFALRQHTGIWRDTKDLDLFLTAANVPKAMSVLEQQGFRCEVCDPVWLAKARHGEYFVDLITGMSNGVITVDDSWIERGSAAIVFGAETRVLGAEELIASKLFVTRRERFDGADIAHVLYGTGGRLDWDRLLALAGDHWQVLFWSLVLFHYIYPASSHVVPRQVWDTMVANFHKSVTQPPNGTPFRGSLIDENMFAIDVQEWGLANLVKQHRESREQIVPECPPSEDAA